MKDKIRHWLLQIFATKIGWLGVSLLSAIVFGVLANNHEWAYWPAMLSWVYPIIFALIMFVYGWILNPIRRYREQKMKK